MQKERVCDCVCARVPLSSKTVDGKNGNKFYYDHRPPPTVATEMYIKYHRRLRAPRKFAFWNTHIHTAHTQIHLHKKGYDGAGWVPIILVPGNVRKEMVGYTSRGLLCAIT